MRRRCKEILKGDESKKGAVALHYTLAALPLLLIVGVSVDFSLLMRARHAAQSAADAAVLAALAPSTTAGDREQVAQAVFLANLPAVLLEMEPHLSLTISEVGNLRSARGVFSLTHPLFLSQYLGGPFSEVGGEASAAVAIVNYMDVDLWLDGSASMGVAADEAARDQLRILSRDDPTHRSCAFACHFPTHLNGPYATTQERARANGVRLRLDVMRDNVIGLVDTLAAQAGPDQRFRYSVNRLALGFEVLLPLSQSETQVRQEIDQFALAGQHALGLSSAASMIEQTIGSGAVSLPPAQGLGGPQDPRRVVVLVTDGMQFNWSAVREGEIEPEVCEQVKQTGAIMAVVQLRYVELNGDWAFEHYVRPHFHQLGPALEACASEGYFFHGETPDEIRQAFGDLASRLQESLRLVR